MKHLIAMYRYQDSDFAMPFTFKTDDEGKERSNPGWVRCTVPQEVEFLDLAREQIVAAAVASIDAEREIVVSDFSKKLATLDRRKAELLALPAPVQA